MLKVWHSGVRHNQSRENFPGGFQDYSGGSNLGSGFQDYSGTSGAAGSGSSGTGTSSGGTASSGGSGTSSSGTRYLGASQNVNVPGGNIRTDVTIDLQQQRITYTGSGDVQDGRESSSVRLNLSGPFRGDQNSGTFSMSGTASQTEVEIEDGRPVRHSASEQVTISGQLQPGGRLIATQVSGGGRSMGLQEGNVIILEPR